MTFGRLTCLVAVCALLPLAGCVEHVEPRDTVIRDDTTSASPTNTSNHTGNQTHGTQVFFLANEDTIDQVRPPHGQDKGRARGR